MRSFRPAPGSPHTLEITATDNQILVRANNSVYSVEEALNLGLIEEVPGEKS